MKTSLMDGNDHRMNKIASEMKSRHSQWKRSNDGCITKERKRTTSIREKLGSNRGTTLITEIDETNCQCRIENIIVMIEYQSIIYIDICFYIFDSFISTSSWNH